MLVKEYIEIKNNTIKELNEEIQILEKINKKYKNLKCDSSATSINQILYTKDVNPIVNRCNYIYINDKIYACPFMITEFGYIFSDPMKIQIGREKDNKYTWIEFEKKIEEHNISPAIIKEINKWKNKNWKHVINL